METLQNEEYWVASMQAGSEEAFTTLYRFYSPRLYLNILGMVRDPAMAEEMVQELFTKVWQKRSAKGIGEDFPAYLYRMALNLVHDFFRRIKRDRKLRQRFSLLAGEAYESGEQSIDHRGLSVLLDTAINRLPTQQKRAWQLIKVQGYTYKAAAIEMGISPLTVKEYLVAANKSIRNNIITGTGGPLGLLCLAT